MRILVFILVIILTITSISAICKEGQIDINTASLEELDGINYIGPVKAQAIIDSRPFDSVDNLINVYGIGEITLEKIKDQGLACVGSEEPEEEIEEKQEEVTDEIEQVLFEHNVSEKSDLNDNEEPLVLETIFLNSKDIKTEENMEFEENRKEIYALYGFVVFCFFIALLFIIKKGKKKNEFR